MGRANRGGACPIDVHQYIGSDYCQIVTLARTAWETMTHTGYIYLLPKGHSPMSKAINPFAGGATIGSLYRFAHMSKPV
jgi:hypothetical protein